MKALKDNKNTCCKSKKKVSVVRNKSWSKGNEKRQTQWGVEREIERECVCVCLCKSVKERVRGGWNQEKSKTDRKTTDKEKMINVIKWKQREWSYFNSGNVKDTTNKIRRWTEK